MRGVPALPEFSTMARAPRSAASLQRFERRLAKIPLDVRAAAATEALLAALALSEAMRQVVPVRTGKTKSTIRVDRGKRGDRFHVKAGGSATTEAGFDTATASEWGTQKEKAKPWFYATWRRNRKQIRAGLDHEIKKAVRKSNG